MPPELSGVNGSRPFWSQFGTGTGGGVKDTSAVTGAPLPLARGPVSEALLQALRKTPASERFPSPRSGDPLVDEDEALALYLCYELAYRGLSGVDDRWEWEPCLISLRAELEERLVRRLRDSLGSIDVTPESVPEAIKTALAADQSPSVSRYLEDNGTLETLKELAIHRSAYQLKEADPHTWAIPRLSGLAKASIVKIQYEEYGEGDEGAMHSSLFALTMRELGLDDTYGAYLDAIPGVTLSGVNLISMFGLNRQWRGALVGHLAGFEMTSVGPNARYARAARRLGVPERGVRFFDVHVDADEEHQLIASTGLAGGLAAAEPALANQIVFGTQCLCLVEGAWARHVTSCWEKGGSSLRGVSVASAA